ncbi:MAG: hypothetical protein KAS17_11535 [Victivallaceae bacterium]|nr:hypothetical protein [Victivallaceae bacterium]
MAEQNGYEATSTVSRELSVLVALDPEAGGGKLSKAGKLGVEIIALSDWLQKVKDSDISEVPENDLFVTPKSNIKEQGTLF